MWLAAHMDDFGVLGRFSGEALERVRLLASELVSNVVVHTDSHVLLAVEREDRALRVSVEDTSPDLPTLRNGPPGALGGGRGLVIVERLAEEWGVEPLPLGGKRVWFSVAYDRGPLAAV